MKKLSTILIFFLLLNIQTSFAQPKNIQPDERGYIVKVGDKISDFKLKFTDGTQKSLKELDKKIIILNFFASWCVVCRKEIPHIEKELWQELKNEDMIVIGVDFKEDLKTTKKFVDEIGMTYPVVLDESGEIFAKFAQGGVTRNVVLNRDLEIIYLTRLYNEAEFKGMIDCVKKELK